MESQFLKQATDAEYWLALHVRSAVIAKHRTQQKWTDSARWWAGSARHYLAKYRQFVARRNPTP